METDPILERLENMKFVYGDGDPTALTELKRRVADAARRRGANKKLTYSELVDGVEFRLLGVDGGRPYSLGFGGWSELDRAIVGSFLGRMSADSYRTGKFFSSALVVTVDTGEPREGFRRLMREIGAHRSSKRDDFILFWCGEVDKALKWYASHSGDGG